VNPLNTAIYKRCESCCKKCKQCLQFEKILKEMDMKERSQLDKEREAAAQLRWQR
jgi:hypothetical protein